MQVFKNKPIIALVILLGHSSSLIAEENEYEISLESAILIAQKNDVWLKGNRHQQEAVKSLGISAGTLPDPKITFGLANLPIDSLDFSQEAMTQLKVGVAQNFARGDSLAIKQKQFAITAGKYPLQRQDRLAQVSLTVGLLWLDAFLTDKSIQLIEADRSLFEQLTDVAEASYSTAQGKTRQQDVIRAQLELTMLDDRLFQLNQQKNNLQGQLSRWLRGDVETLEVSQLSSLEQTSFQNINFGQDLPKIVLKQQHLFAKNNRIAQNELVNYFIEHPSVLVIGKDIQASTTDIELAKQQYKPQWGLNASYGYRASDAMNNNRADFFSIGVAVDLPLFTENKQTQEVSAVISKTEAIKTQRLLLLRKLMAEFSSGKGRLKALLARQALYKNKLLPQIKDQAEASLTAYTNDDGDFSEVVRARIAELNAKIGLLKINVEQQKVIMAMNYLFTKGVDTKALTGAKND